MDARHKKILQSNRHNLVRQLDSSDLYDGLLSGDIFTQDSTWTLVVVEGDPGLPGEKGPAGGKGLEVVQGCQGRKGETGSKGALGDPSLPGEKGPAGGKGLEVVQGDQGRKGEPGSKGALEIIVERNPTTGISHASWGRLFGRGMEIINFAKEHVRKGEMCRIWFPAFREHLLIGPERVMQILLNWDTPNPPMPTPLQPTLLPVPLGPENMLSCRPMGITRMDSTESYKMDASPCGLCLIINNVDFEPESELSRRRGSDVDCDRLKKRFMSLNFVVTVKKNLKKKQIKQELSSLSKEDHSKYDCCVVIILSHGTETNHRRFPGAVYGVDGALVPIQDITSYFYGCNCPSLQEKPKLFFIQACGGSVRDTGFEVSPDDFQPSARGVDDQPDDVLMSSSSISLSFSDKVDTRASLPTTSDILVSYSTFPGYVSWRDTQTGSWYVETLDRVLEERAARKDLVTMLVMVNNEVSKISTNGRYKQMPVSITILRKPFYFQTPPLNKNPPTSTGLQ